MNYYKYRDSDNVPYCNLCILPIHACGYMGSTNSDLRGDL